MEVPYEKRVAKKYGCDGKIGHSTAASAQRQLDRIKGDKSRMNVYQCLYCPKWHIGNLIKDKY